MVPVFQIANDATSFRWDIWFWCVAVRLEYCILQLTILFLRFSTKCVNGLYMAIASQNHLPLFGRSDLRNTNNKVYLIYISSRRPLPHNNTYVHFIDIDRRCVIDFLYYTASCLSFYGYYCDARKYGVSDVLWMGLWSLYHLWLRVKTFIIYFCIKDSDGDSIPDLEPCTPTDKEDNMGKSSNPVFRNSCPIEKNMTMTPHILEGIDTGDKIIPDGSRSYYVD